MHWVSFIRVTVRSCSASRPRSSGYILIPGSTGKRVIGQPSASTIIHMIGAAAGASSFAQASVPRNRNSIPLPVQSRASGDCEISILPIRRIPGVEAVMLIV